MAIFTGTCWRHWPKACSCPPSEDEVERIKADAMLAQREKTNDNK